MLAKVLMVLCASGCALAAPGIYGGVGVGYAPAAIAHAPIYAKQVIQPEIVDPNPAYSFSYGVSDPHTGDHKDASETLENGVVHGSYSLLEPDGHLRKVTYTADNVNGFNAVVERAGAGGAPVVAAPIAKYAVAPAAHLAYAAPVAHPWG